MRKINRLNKKRLIYKLQNGGSADDMIFNDWYSAYASKRDLDPNPDADEHYYDYKAYWKDNQKELSKNIDIEEHLPDTYKKPGHPTFSDQSLYSNEKTPGGHWEGNKFTHSKFTEQTWERTLRYMRESGKGNEETFFPDGKPVYTDEKGYWPVNKLYPNINQAKFNDFVDKVRGSRKGARDNDDGSHSTVLMMNSDFTDDDGNEIGVAYPSLYQKGDGTWYEPSDPVQESKDKKEGYMFDSPDKASWFARGAWKDDYYDRDTGKFKDAKLEKPKETKARGGSMLMYQSGGQADDGLAYYTEPDWRGNKFQSGVTNIHQGYEMNLALDLGVEKLDIDKLYRYFAAVGSHEGHGNRWQKQEGAGPGRGLYQIEDNQKNGGDYRTQYEKFMRIKRLKTPEWYSNWEGTDVSGLGKQEQLELLMAYNYFGKGNRKNILSFMNDEIGPGELAARNHKRSFSARGEVGDKDYKTKEEFRQEYIDDVNKFYKEQDSTRVNQVLFDNDYANRTSGVEPTEAPSTRPTEFGYRCGDEGCALPEEFQVKKSAPGFSPEIPGIGGGSTPSEFKLFQLGGNFGTRKTIKDTKIPGQEKTAFIEPGAEETFKVGTQRYADVYNNTDKNNMYNNTADGVANMGMLDEVVVTGDLDEKDKWKKDAKGHYEIDSNGKKVWKLDTRTDVELNMDKLEKTINKGAVGMFGKTAGPIVASPLTSFPNMAANLSKTFTGGGNNTYTKDMPDPANKNRWNAGKDFAIDAALTFGLPAVGKLASSSSKGIKTAINTTRNTRFKDGFKGGVSDVVENLVTGGTNKLLKHNKTGKVGDAIHSYGNKFKNSSVGGEGKGALKVLTDSHVGGAYIEDSLKNPIKSGLSMRRKGGIIYKKK
ncbi:MAG: hypothetical protein KAH32_05975 [Chlamydiia bacterium]|nr:hypothetical protein [Chlamydiia bacterium]